MLRTIQISLFAFALLASGQQAFASETSLNFSEAGISQDQSIDATLRPRPPGRPGRGRTQVCFAQNARGVVFRARGPAYNRYVQNAALRQCQQNSFNPRTCRPLGCQLN